MKFIKITKSDRHGICGCYILMIDAISSLTDEIETTIDEINNYSYEDVSVKWCVEIVDMNPEDYKKLLEFVGY